MIRAGRLAAAAFIGLLSCAAGAKGNQMFETPKPPKLEQSMRVQSFSTASDRVVVLFAESPAECTLARGQDGFADSVRALAAGWQSGKPVKVVRDGATVILSVSGP